MDGICPVDEGSRPPAKEGLCACVHNETVYVLSGRDPSSPYTPQSTIHTLDTESKVWTKMTSRGEATPPFTAGSSCVAIGNRIYTFGGWLRGAVNNQIHEFNIETKTWKHLEPYNTAHQPMMKNKQGMVAHGDDALLIFGGYGEPAIGASLQKGADYIIDNSSLWFSLLWTNELHLFRIRGREWVEPEVTGPRPKPCAAFSFDRIDKERVVVFGGRQKEERVNEMHILDTSNWVWNNGSIILFHNRSCILTIAIQTNPMACAIIIFLFRYSVGVGCYYPLVLMSHGLASDHFTQPVH